MCEKLRQVDNPVSTLIWTYSQKQTASLVWMYGQILIILQIQVRTIYDFPFEVDGSDLLGPVLVKARLRAKIGFSREVLQASPAVWILLSLDMYILHLMSQPTPFMSKNQLSPVQDKEFVDQCIDPLLNSACIKELREAPYVCSPLSVVESNSGKRG